jgi:acetate kinase
MGVAPLILVANPGSASRKYALYRGNSCIARLHFEYEREAVICTLQQGEEQRRLAVSLYSLESAASLVLGILRSESLLTADEAIQKVGLRIVAPSAFFLCDRVVDDEVIARLEALERRAPLHIHATLEELRILREQFASAEIVGLSDSAFHATKPDYAWNYGIPLRDADQFDVKRFGYHGLSVSSVVHSLRQAEKLPPKVVICHLGSGASVTAVHHGKSIDTTMGYSPLEGVIMGTRSGNVDPTAVKVLQEALSLDDNAMQEYLNKQSGLLGLSGRSADIRELLQFEAEADHYAGLALRTYVYNVQKAIGQMVAALGGLDILVFTGTVGERSPVMRERILHALHYLDILVDSHANNRCLAPDNVVVISKIAHSRPVLVVPANETEEMLSHLIKL